MKKKFNYLLLASFIVLVIYIVIKRYQLKQNHLITYALIIAAGETMDKSGDWSVTYTYENTEGSTFRSTTFVPLILARKNRLIGKSIPVVYYKEDNTRSQLLLYKQTWKQYSLPFPDSLSWLNTVIDESRVLYSY